MTSIKNLTGIIRISAMALAFSVAVAAQTSPTPTGQPSPSVPQTPLSAAVPQTAVTAANLSAASSTTPPPPPANNVTGKWIDTFGYQWNISQDAAGKITGFADVEFDGFCPTPWPVTGTATPSSFLLFAANPVPDNCAPWFRYNMTFTSLTTAVGTWTNFYGTSADVSMRMVANCRKDSPVSVLNNAFEGPELSGGGLLSGSTNISASFAPELNGVPINLQDAAELCGFVNFDWVQIATEEPDPAPFFFRSNGQRITSANDVPYYDPPPGGGYTYEPQFDNSYPFYYDAYVPLGTTPWGLLDHETDGYTLTFDDAPRDPCLPGPLWLPSVAWLKNPALCLYKLAPKGSKESFVTYLVGVQVAKSSKLSAAVYLGIGFTWTNTFNGTTGGIAQTKSDGTVPPDPGSGTGGITVTSVNRTATYDYSGTPVIPAVLLAGSQVRSQASESEYETGVCASHLVITNVSGAPVVGPFQIVFLNLKSGVVLQNALNSSGQMNTFGGFPFITVPDVSSMATGESTRISLQFSAGSEDQCESIRYTPLVYTGTLIN